MDLKFAMGDKVKVLKDNKYNEHNKIGLITALYDANHTPHNYARCDYRVLFEDNSKTVYCNECDLRSVKIVKAYAYVDKHGNYVWVNSLNNNLSKKMFKRAESLDIEKEIE